MDGKLCGKNMETFARFLPHTHIHIQSYAYIIYKRYIYTHTHIYIYIYMHANTITLFYMPCHGSCQVSRKRWSKFLSHLRFDEPLEFNEGDAGSPRYGAGVIAG